jgi:hypothetical protein
MRAGILAQRGGGAALPVFSARNTDRRDGLGGKLGEMLRGLGRLVVEAQRQPAGDEIRFQRRLAATGEPVRGGDGVGAGGVAQAQRAADEGLAFVPQRPGQFLVVRRRCLAPPGGKRAVLVLAAQQPALAS